MWACARPSDLIRAAALAFGLGAAGVAGPRPRRASCRSTSAPTSWRFFWRPRPSCRSRRLRPTPRPRRFSTTSRRLTPRTARAAEEIFLLNPDLVLAGIWSEAETVAILRRLGLRVETLPPVATLDEMRDQIRRMGALLAREDRAEALLRDFDADLAALRRDTPDATAVIYYANGFAGGDASLAGEALRAAGIRNLAAEAGFGGARLPLELLVTMEPDLIVAGTAIPAPRGPRRSSTTLRWPIPSPDVPS